MTHLGLILSVAVLTYCTRIAGFALGQRRIPLLLDRFLTYIPVAVFAALITPGLGIGTPEITPRLAGAGAATLVTLRLRHLWAGLGVGMVVYWLARAALPQ